MASLLRRALNPRVAFVFVFVFAVLFASAPALASPPTAQVVTREDPARAGLARRLQRGLGKAYRNTCKLGREACRRVFTREGRAQTRAGVARAARTSCRVVKRTALATCQWAKKNPAKALGIGLGTAAMFGTVLYIAPALSSVVAQWATPIIGKTAASVLGTASGGALACGARSFLVHATPMVAKIDPFNAKQLATDTSMSAGFGFVGFAQAAVLKMVTGVTGATGLGLFATNAVGLIGYEMGKNYLQNRIRNRVANDPKNFRDIWKSALKMETASNIARCIPGLNLETNYLAKIAGDLGGTVWWDRIVNARNGDKASAKVKPLSSQQRQTRNHLHHVLTN